MGELRAKGSIYWRARSRESWRHQRESCLSGIVLGALALLGSGETLEVAQFMRSSRILLSCRRAFRLIHAAGAQDASAALSAPAFLLRKG